MRRTLDAPLVSVRYEEDAALAVVDAVSTVTDRPPAEIGPLNDVIDPRALNDVFGPTRTGGARSGGRVRFPFEGFSVVIDVERREVRLYE